MTAIAAEPRERVAVAMQQQEQHPKEEEKEEETIPNMSFSSSPESIDNENEITNENDDIYAYFQFDSLPPLNLLRPQASTSATSISPSLLLHRCQTPIKDINSRQLDDEKSRISSSTIPSCGSIQSSSRFDPFSDDASILVSTKKKDHRPLQQHEQHAKRQHTSNDILGQLSSPTSYSSSLSTIPSPFKLLIEPYEKQRKAYRTENRFLLPNPLILKADECITKKLVYAVAKVKLVGQHGEDIEAMKVRQGQEQPIEGNLMKVFDSNGLARFSLKCSITSEKQRFRLLFTICYQLRSEEEATPIETSSVSSSSMSSSSSPLTSSDQSLMAIVVSEPFQVVSSRRLDSLGECLMESANRKVE